jgi:hypothetical protein
MGKIVPQTEKDAIHLTAHQAIAMRRHPPVSEASFKRRLAERFSVRGAQVVCHRRTIIGTWKASETPFQVYNLGMGGVNFWNLGMILKPGTKIKLTLLMPKLQPIDVVGIVIWNKDGPHAGASDDVQAYGRITGVKFVDYDAGAWAVLRRIPEIVNAQLKEDPLSELPPSQDQSAPSLTIRPST